jgi:hypothetical protein
MAAALEHEFLPYLERTAALMVPCINYKLSEGVRSAAVDHMVSLLAAARAGVERGLLRPEDMQALWQRIFPLFMQAAISEPEADAQASLYEEIAACVDKCGAGCLAPEQQLQLCQVVQPLFEDLLKPKKPSQDEDEEEDDFEEVGASHPMRAFTASRSPESHYESSASGRSRVP